MMSATNLSVILFTVFLSACAQLLLKIGVSQKNMNFQATDLFQMLFNIPVLLGIAIYGASVLIWLWVLSRVDLSLAYPFVGLSFVFTLLFGYFLLDETVNLSRLLGTALIILGCFFVAKS